MSDRGRPTSRVMHSVRLLLLIGGGIAASASPLFAHGKLLSSDPGAGAKLTASPRTVRLDFSEAAELTFTRVSIVTSAGDTIALVALRHPGESRRSVIADVPVNLSVGDFRIVWRMAGADGHPTRGEIHFSVLAAPTADTIRARDTAVAGLGTRASPITPEVRGFGVESPAYVMIRWLEFCALLAVIGAVAFRNAVLPRLRSSIESSGSQGEIERRTAVWGRNAALALAVTAVLRLIAQTLAMRAAGTPIATSGANRLVFGSAWARAWVLQVVLAAITAIVLSYCASRRTNEGTARTWWMLATATTMMLAFTPALSGHAAADLRLAGAAIIIDGVHVMAAGGWLGTLLVTITIGLRGAMDSNRSGLYAADLIDAFSPVALAFAGTAAVTGAISAWVQLGSLSALFHDRYGGVLLLKLAMIALAAVVGAWNWRRARPSLRRGAEPVGIRRSASAEIALGAVVLLVTAVLVALPTPVSQSH